MRSRVAGRLLTGPPGFFLAGAIDLTVAWLGWAAQRLALRLARRAAR